LEHDKHTRWTAKERDERPKIKSRTRNEHGKRSGDDKEQSKERKTDRYHRRRCKPAPTDMKNGLAGRQTKRESMRTDMMSGFRGEDFGLITGFGV
jgi:hypothetical protein